LKFVLNAGVSGLAIPLVAIIHERTGTFSLLFYLLCALACVVVAAGWLLPGTKMAASAQAAK
jgi:hypothetical membrane protein